MRSSSSSSSSSGGIGFFGAMFLIFLTLKLTGKIDWSWWWVTAPLWGFLAFVAVIAITAFGGIFAYYSAKKAIAKSRQKKFRAELEAKKTK